MVLGYNTDLCKQGFVCFQQNNINQEVIVLSNNTLSFVSLLSRSPIYHSPREHMITSTGFMGGHVEDGPGAQVRLSN